MEQFKPRVAVITPTVGTDHLKINIESVEEQSYNNFIHYVVVDGPQFEGKVNDQFSNGINRRIVLLPENTGHSQYNGHRIYGAMPYLTDADYVIFLDEDNWIDSGHIETLVKVAEHKDWAFSFRKIVGQDNEFICNDDCESLGKWHTCLNEKEFFLDTGCYFLPKALAVQLSPAWYRRARHPQEQPEVDRLLMHMLLQNQYTFDTTYEYTLNYRVGNREDSVRKEFFLNGNKWMLEKYNGELPWKKSDNS